MSKKSKILLHIAFWVYTFLLKETALQISYGKSWTVALDIFNPLAITNYCIFSVIFYMNYYMVMPRIMQNYKYFQAILFWLLLITAYILLRYCIQEVLMRNLFGICNFCEFNLYGYIISHFFQAITWILLPSTVIWLLQSTIETQKRNLVLQEEKIKNERAFLQAQLNPHLIFNSLHTIYSMVFHKAAESLDAIKTFSDILRHTLNPARSELVSLNSELDHLKKYISLQEYRNRNPVVHFTTQGNTENFMIPPLLLITLVENAFKHGYYTDPKFPIAIELTVSEIMLSFSVTNKINPNRIINSTTIGLPSLKRILELTYGNRHELKIEEINEQYNVILIIKNI